MPLPVAPRKMTRFCFPLRQIAGMVLAASLLAAAWSLASPGTAQAEQGVITEDGVLVGSTLSGGGHHTCALQADGTLACWGGDYYGETEPPAGTFRQVSAGLYHACGIQADGTVACWGWGDEGQLAAPSGTFHQVSAGQKHTCGLRTDGTVACWGDDYYDAIFPPSLYYTQVSAGGYHSCGVTPYGSAICWGWTLYGQSTPPLDDFLQVSCGDIHSCGLRTDGTVACWGNNGSDRATPPAGTFTQVMAGHDHTCGLRADGTVACWGDNTDGQASPPSGTFREISGGDYHTCGLRTDGSVSCWGNDTDGRSSPSCGTFGRWQLSAGYRHTCGVRSDGSVSCWGLDVNGSVTPPAGTFTQVGAGDSHNCGVQADGTMACWGWNLYGQATPLAGTFSQVSSGWGHTCGLHADGTVSCWGSDTYGQDADPPGTFRQIAAGSYHNCGILTDGSAICWGHNDDFRATVPGGTGALTQVSCGGEHSCGVKLNGTVVCWGWNEFGQTAAPTGTFTQLGTGQAHSCGLRTDGTVACWGANHFGQATPAAGTFTQIAVGSYHTCGRRTDGTLSCWGEEDYGRCDAPVPDITVTKVSDTAGIPAAGKVFTWTITISNAGGDQASFNDTDAILLDGLSDTNIGYGPVTVLDTSGVVCPDHLGCIIDISGGSFNLRCKADGGPVVLPAGSSFDVQFPAAPSDGGAFTNPRDGSICQVDPDSLVAEGDETNNDCSDSVLILPDLTVSKTHSTGGIISPGTPVTWTITISNDGIHEATFSDAETIFADNLPDSGMDYGPVSLANESGLTFAGGTLGCGIDSSSDLTCDVSGGTLTIDVGGGFDVLFTATPRVGGTITNPRASGICQVDPDSLVEELDDTNNDCSDSLEVFHLGISRAEDDLQLNWSNVGADRYSLWHSMEDPYSVPGADCSTSFDCKTIGGTSFDHSGSASDGSHHFYLVEAIDGSENVFATSNRVGKFLFGVVPGVP